jgi:hypothetical protein
MKNLTRLFLLPALLSAGMLMSAGLINDGAPAPANPPAMSAYPNPFSTYITVAVTGAMNKPMIITLRSASSGAIMLQSNVTYTAPVTLNTSSVPSGNYLLYVYSPMGYSLGKAEVRKL